MEGRGRGARRGRRGEAGRGEGDDHAEEGFAGDGAGAHADQDRGGREGEEALSGVGGGWWGGQVDQAVGDQEEEEVRAMMVAPSISRERKASTEESASGGKTKAA